MPPIAGEVRLHQCPHTLPGLPHAPIPVSSTSTPIRPRQLHLRLLCDRPRCSPRVSRRQSVEVCAPDCTRRGEPVLQHSAVGLADQGSGAGAVGIEESWKDGSMVPTALGSRPSATCWSLIVSPRDLQGTTCLPPPRCFPTLTCKRASGPSQPVKCAKENNTHSISTYLLRSAARITLTVSYCQSVLPGISGTLQFQFASDMLSCLPVHK